MSGQHLDGISQREQPILDGIDERAIVAAGQVGTSDRTREQRVAHEHVVIPKDGDASGRVAGTVYDAQPVVGAEGEFVAVPDERIGRGRRAQLKPEDAPLRRQVHIQRLLVLVQRNHSPRLFFEPADLTGMVNMRMRENDVLHLEVVGAQEPADLTRKLARVDDHRLAGFLTAENETI